MKYLKMFVGMVLIFAFCVIVDLVFIFTSKISNSSTTPVKQAISYNDNDHNYIILQYSGGHIINCWILKHNDSFYSYRGGAGWDGNGFNNKGHYVAGDIVAESVLNDNFQAIFDEYNVMNSNACHVEDGKHA